MGTGSARARGYTAPAGRARLYMRELGLALKVLNFYSVAAHLSPLPWVLGAEYSVSPAGDGEHVIVAIVGAYGSAVVLTSGPTGQGIYVKRAPAGPEGGDPLEKLESIADTFRDYCESCMSMTDIAVSILEESERVAGPLSGDRLASQISAEEGAGAKAIVATANPVVDVEYLLGAVTPRAPLGEEGVHRFYDAVFAAGQLALLPGVLARVFDSRPAELGRLYALALREQAGIPAGLRGPVLAVLASSLALVGPGAPYYRVASREAVGWRMFDRVVWSYDERETPIARRVIGYVEKWLTRYWQEIRSEEEKHGLILESMESEGVELVGRLYKLEYKITAADYTIDNTSDISITIAPSGLPRDIPAPRIRIDRMSLKSYTAYKSHVAALALALASHPAGEDLVAELVRTAEQVFAGSVLLASVTRVVPA